ncbi:MAG TPA: LiaF domain-containing protein [Cyclobacteriaceae bacterium]|jgi:predicted membrane protein|nr:LiaF domain-containing protein [Cyclobacteriaceae bacterium]
METTDGNKERFKSRSGKSLAGLILVVVGGALLGRELGVDIPSWLFSWQAGLIALGFFFGARRMFRPGGWLVMIFVGAAFMLDEYYGDHEFHHLIWPMAIILLGLWMILRPKREKRDWSNWTIESNSSEHTIDVNSVFGGTKRKVVSKEFKGGEINSVFGGNDIDFSQADFNGTATLETNVVFGGIKLIVPPHWKIESKVDCVFASVEDKRRETSEVAENKTLILKGGVVFGSIEIKSY